MPTDHNSAPPNGTNSTPERLNAPPPASYTPEQADAWNTAETQFARILEGNKRWAQAQTATDADYFKRMAQSQSPNFMWIGCSDSRVPAEEVCGMLPGDLFVHRNVANLVVTTDFNLLSVLEYATHHLKVDHIIVCGHYGCGGVNAAMGNGDLGVINKWIRQIKEVYLENLAELEALDETARAHRLVELNVIKQVHNLSHTSIIQRAWSGGRHLHLHGMVYSLEDGSLRDLRCSITGAEDLHPIYRFQSTDMHS